MITIRIEGLRGEGKTTTAMAIVQLLRGLGQTVGYRGFAFNQAQTVEELLADPDFVPVFSKPNQIEVIDVCAKD
jgi:signal recognition particle GTPase